MSLNIVTVPNPILREISQPVTQFDAKLSTFIAELSYTLTHSQVPGVGISAIQVGQPLRLFLTYFPTNPDLPLKKWGKAKTEIKAYINPEIVAHSQDLFLGDTKGDTQMEGCLSIPKVWGHVWRYTWVDLKYLDLSLPDPGSYHTTRFTGFAARVIQHEMDHLDGILFTDHITSKSPIKGFAPLKPHSNHLFFEHDGDFIAIDNPSAFAKW